MRRLFELAIILILSWALFAFAIYGAWQFYVNHLRG